MGRLTHHTGPGWTYFVTTKAWQSAFLFQVDETARIKVAKMLDYRARGNYLLHDFVLMPNHLHVILTPGSAVSLEKAIQLIKGGSSHEIHRVRGKTTPIWQFGFHESRVTSWTDYQMKKDYIHFNPVAATLVESPEEWVFGSANGQFEMDPIPQGLKPVLSGQANVGAKAPTPGAPSKNIATAGAIPGAPSMNAASAAATAGAPTKNPATAGAHLGQGNS